MRLVVLVVSALAVGVVGCGVDSDLCSEGGGGTGALQLDISGLPDSTNAAVTVTRGTESRAVTGSTRLEGLSIGPWLINTSPVAASGGLVRAAYDAPRVKTVCVREGKTVNEPVAYALIPSSQKLWLSTS